ncbi:MAG: porin family protein [Agarilytica sp.]
MPLKKLSYLISALSVVSLPCLADVAQVENASEQMPEQTAEQKTESAPSGQANQSVMHEKRPEIVNTKHGFYFSLGEFDLSSKVAREEGVKDNATYFQFAWQAQDKTWLWGAGLSGLLYTDRRDFTQFVEDQSGDEFSADSEAQAVNIFGEGGYAYAPSKFVSLDMLVGLEVVLSSERSIANCTDCYSEDIDINSGLYISPRVRLLAGEHGFMVGLAYQRYLEADIEGGVMLTIGGRF